MRITPHNPHNNNFFSKDIMNKKDNQNHLKENRYENLLTLKRAIDNHSLDEINEFDGEWGGSYVIITSSPDKIHNRETDGDDWYGHRSSCTYVLTKNSYELSKLFAYVGEKIMKRRDNYLYGFMALLAIDFIGQFGDTRKYKILNYVLSGVSFYLGYFDWESGMGNPKNAFNIMRFFLLEQISDEEIRHIL